MDEDVEEDDFETTEDTTQDKKRLIENPEDDQD